MSRISFTIEGLVVGREEMAEGHRDLSLFSFARGLLRCRLRLSSNKPSTIPDLFSEVEAVVNPLSGNHLFFLGEWRVTRARPAIGTHYRRLEAAGALARLILLNARWLETFDCFHTLTCNALDALSGEASPEAVRLKAFYLMVQTEGYPVKESWLAEREASDRESLDLLLSRPVAFCDAPLDNLIRWRRDLERWIVAETDFSL
ncbi:MAG: hypothetical protein VB980_00635 [Opitutales bacterium]|jgi:hypothetical protein